MRDSGQLKQAFMRMCVCVCVCLQKPAPGVHKPVASTWCVLKSSPSLPILPAVFCLPSPPLNTHPSPNSSHL